jgi:hypothetical protein
MGGQMVSLGFRIRSPLRLYRSPLRGERGEEEELHLREERTAARESYHRRQELSPLGESRHERAIVSRPPMELLDFHVYCAWIGSGSSEYSSLPNAVFFLEWNLGPRAYGYPLRGVD